MGQELSFPWTMVPVAAEVLERAGSRDHKAIREAATKLDIHDVPATRHLAKQGMAFDSTGRIAEKYRGVLIIQWQGGKPVVVYPPNLASAKPVWISK
jgi:hypothetical protein